MRKLLYHLYTTYAQISPADLQHNDAKLRSPYDANHPIKNLFNHVDNAVEYAASGETPYTPKQVVTMTYQLVFQTCLFLDDCKFRKHKTEANRTWTNFKSHFSGPHQEWHKTQDTTASAGFQSANLAYQQDTVYAIANLATATASDCASVATLSATNITMAAEISA